MNEDLEKVRLAIVKKFEYQVAQTEDAFLHHDLLVPYLLVQVLGTLEIVNSNLIDVENEVSKLNPDYK